MSKKSEYTLKYKRPRCCWEVEGRQCYNTCEMGYLVCYPHRRHRNEAVRKLYYNATDEEARKKFGEVWPF